MLQEANAINNDLYNTMGGEDMFERQTLSQQETAAWDMQSKQVMQGQDEIKLFNM